VHFYIVYLETGPSGQHLNCSTPFSQVQGQKIPQEENKLKGRMLNKVLKDIQKGDFYVHILPHWLQSSLYYRKLLLSIAVALKTNQTIYSSISCEHVITWQINQHSLHWKIQRDRFTPWFQGDLQSETEMETAQGFSSFSALPVLLQAVPAGNGPHQCHSSIKRSHTFPSCGFWKSTKANRGIGDELGWNLVLGLPVRYLSSLLSGLPPLERMSHIPHLYCICIVFLPSDCIGVTEEK